MKSKALQAFFQFNGAILAALAFIQFERRNWSMGVFNLIWSYLNYYWALKEDKDDAKS